MVFQNNILWNYCHGQIQANNDRLLTAALTASVAAVECHKGLNHVGTTSSARTNPETSLSVCIQGYVEDVRNADFVRQTDLSTPDTCCFINNAQRWFTIRQAQQSMEKRVGLLFIISILRHLFEHNVPANFLSGCLMFSLVLASKMVERAGLESRLYEKGKDQRVLRQHIFTPLLDGVWDWTVTNGLFKLFPSGLDTNHGAIKRGAFFCQKLYAFCLLRGNPWILHIKVS